MKRFWLIAIAALFAATAAFANDPGGCPPVGGPSPGPAQPYDFIANGLPNGDSCWYKTNITYFYGYQGPDACGYWRDRWVFNAGTATLSQRFYVPSDAYGPITAMKLIYILDFTDPTNNGNDNAITADITDLTAGRWLGGNFYSGWSGSVGCSQRIGFASSPTDLRGHYIELKFTTRKANNTAVQINVKYVDLLAN